MKRRKFLKTVGGATAATALGGCTTTPPTTPAPIKAAAKTKKGRPALTYRLEEVTPGNATDSPSPLSTLRIRLPFWHPDGSHPDGTPHANTPPDVPPDPGNPQGGAHRQQVFQEEAIGIHRLDGLIRPFKIDFNYKGVSKKWILGGKIAKTAPRGETQLTALVKALALKVRRYNASLYRLRRIHYCNKFNAPNNKQYWPQANPDGGDEPDPTSGNVSDRVLKAEKNWCKVTDDLDDFIENAKAGYPPTKNLIQLKGVDMVEVNNYIIAMRVVVDIFPGATPGGPEIPGSSSHVSISTPFSSSSP